MPAAVSSVFKTSIALAGASVIALSPLVPAQDVRVPTVTLPSIELTGLPVVPAIGAIPYQIGINLLGDLLALAPIVAGSVEQCTVCLGPNTPPPDSRYAPFTGWGALGIAAGILTSPLALVDALQSTGDVGKALGIALLAVQAPIQNTFTLFEFSRTVGGFAFYSTLGRVSDVFFEAAIGAARIAQAVVAAPVTILIGAVQGATEFAKTLASTGDFAAAIDAGRAKLEPAVDTAVAAVTNQIRDTRINVYTFANYGPGKATFPIPTVPPVAAAPVAARAAAEESSGPATKVTDSVKAVPGTTAGSSDDHESGSAAAKSDNGTEGSSAPTPKTGKSTGSSKRQHKSDSAA